MKCTISTSDAPATVDAHSQTTTSDELLLTVGQFPLTPDGELLDDALIGDQTEQRLENVAVTLITEGTSLDGMLKTTVFLDDIDDFEELNKVCGEFFDEDPPARSAVEVSNVPKGVTIKIEAVAVTEWTTHR